VNTWLRTLVLMVAASLIFGCTAGNPYIYTGAALGTGVGALGGAAIDSTNPYRGPSEGCWARSWAGWAAKWCASNSIPRLPRVITSRATAPRGAMPPRRDIARRPAMATARLRREITVRARARRALRTTARLLARRGRRITASLPAPRAPRITARLPASRPPSTATGAPRLTLTIIIPNPSPIPRPVRIPTSDRGINTKVHSKGYCRRGAIYCARRGGRDKSRPNFVWLRLGIIPFPVSGFQFSIK